MERTNKMITPNDDPKAGRVGPEGRTRRTPKLCEVCEAPVYNHKTTCPFYRPPKEK